MRMFGYLFKSVCAFPVFVDLRIGRGVWREGGRESRERWREGKLRERESRV